MTSASTVWTPGQWMPYCRGGEAATPSQLGTVPEMATAHVRVRSAARATLLACLQGPPPDASEDVWPHAFRILKYPVGLSHPALPDVGVAGGQLVHVQRPSVVGADCRLVVESDLSSGDRARPGLERRDVFPMPRRASALVHYQVSCVSWLVL